MPERHTSSERKGAIAAFVLLIIAVIAVIWSSGAFRSDPVPVAHDSEADMQTVTRAEADSILRAKDSKSKSRKGGRKKKGTGKKSGEGTYDRHYRDETIN